MSATFITRGEGYLVDPNGTVAVTKELPKGVYSLEFVANVGWVLQPQSEFLLPKRLYGELPGRAERILETYEYFVSRGRGMGVLLSGTPGSGKTLLAKRVCEMSNLPVVLVNTAYTQDDFARILAGLGKAVVIFDEFEKVYYKREDQSSVLTLLDGTRDHTLLTFVICNEASRLLEPFLCRPSRLYYHFNYKGMEPSHIEEYCQEHLEDTSHIQTLLTLAAAFPHFNFDMLSSLVLEMNRHGESPAEAVKWLNIGAPYLAPWTQYEVTCQDTTGKPLHIKPGADRLKHHPLEQRFLLYFSRDEEPPGPGQNWPEYIYVEPEMLTAVEDNNTTLVFDASVVVVRVTECQKEKTVGFR